MAMILSAFLPQLIRLLDGIIEEEAILLLGVTYELKTLKKRMEMLDMLHDAENRRQNERPISQWLNDLREIVYNIDDIIDHCKIEGERRKRLMEQQTRSIGSVFTVKCPFPLFSCFTKVTFRHEIGDRIKGLTTKLDQVVMEASKFRFISTQQGDKISPLRNYVLRVADPVVIGMQMEDDIKNMVKMLTQENQKNFFAITGTEGIGKTTLAQKIYNDERVKAHFQLKIWVCVTKQFIDVNILKDVISGAGGSYGEAQTREQLETIVERLLEDKKFLLVLDDMWSNHIWQNLLRSSLQRKTTGSMILITTRNEAIAEEIPGVHLHRMKILPTRDGWSLLSNKVFQDGHEPERQDLTNIGLKIVRKCKGLPLAINIIAGVLRNKEMLYETWEKVFLDPAWSSPDLPNDVSRALYLGYQDLPSHLKQCFVYCSLFPEGHVFDHRLLIQYWIAEGLVEVKENMIVEDTAEAYYKELLCRNLISLDSSLRDGCKMHGLLRFLAHFVAGQENLFGNWSLADATTTKPRRLSIAARGLRELPEEIAMQESLRTLLLFKNPLRKISPEGLLNRLRLLRVLDIHDTLIESLPNSIGDLIHLRYLNVSSTRLRQLPDTVERLINLQFLSVRDCELMNSLPTCLVKLQSLRSLDIVGTQINNLPIGLGKLENLNLLLGFIVDDDNEGPLTCTLEELSPLTQLQHLSLQKMERIPGGADAARAKLKNKKQLRSLSLNWSNYFAGAHRHEMEKSREVLEELCPPPTVEVIEITGFPGYEHPSWLSISCLLNSLRHLVLKRCPYIQQLPQLGHLPQLRHLYISGALAVTTIGSEFFGLDMYPPFPKLDRMILEDMINWEDWQWQQEDGEALPCLRELQLINCPKLRSLPEGLHYAANLSVLVIHGADSIQAIKDLSSVKTLILHYNSNLEEVSYLPGLQFLKVSNCPAWRKIEHIHGLRYLHLIDDSMDYLPQGLGEEITKEIQWLEMECNEEFISKCLVGGSEWSNLRHIASIHIHTKDYLKYLSYGKGLQTQETNIQSTEMASEMAVVPFVPDAPSTSPPAIIMERPGTNMDPFLSPHYKLLFILGTSLVFSALLDYLFMSQKDFLTLGTTTVSILIEAAFILITIPLGIVRDTFGLLNYVISTVHKLFDQLVEGLDILSFSLGTVTKFLLDFLFFSPYFSFVFMLLSLIASYSSWFQ